MKTANKNKRLPAFFFLVTCALCATRAVCSAESVWPQFQGPPHDASAANLPTHWSATDNILWQAELPGYGQSSPVIGNGMVVVTTISGPNKENCHILALDVHSGKTLWQHDLKAASGAKNNTYVSRAAPTPFIDEDQITVLFEGGNLLSLDHSGNPRWERNLVADYGEIKSTHGIAASLEQNDDDAFVWIERKNDPYLLAVSKKDGKTLWKSPGLGVTSWSSPRLVPVGDSHHLVISGVGKLAGYDPENGKQLWLLEDISGNSTPTPVPVGNGQFLIAATTGSRSSVSPGKAARSNGLVEIRQAADGTFGAAFLWRAKRATSSFGSPLAHRGNAYFVNKQGVIYCLDLVNGKEKYAKRTAGSVWATPIASGERMYFFGKNGITTIVKAGDAFLKIAENDLFTTGQEESKPTAAPTAPAMGGQVLYAAALDGERLFLRTGRVLYCLQQ